MSSFWTIVSALLLLPYIGWGVYTLRLRYVYHEELETLWEACTLALVMLFCSIEIVLLRGLMGESVIIYLFSVLGIITATAALYGPMLVSLAAHLTVEFIHPEHRRDDHLPDFGPAEALESMGDWDGALKEYTVIARIFPKDPEPVLKMADMLTELDRPEDAARMFERGLFLLDDEEREWKIINRLAGLFENRLGDNDEAVRILSVHIDFYPESEVRETIEQRIERLQEKDPQPAQPPKPTSSKPEPELELDSGSDSESALELDHESTTEAELELDWEPELDAQPEPELEREPESSSEPELELERPDDDPSG